MAVLQFLYGKDIVSKNPAVKPGTLYLDTQTKEMWFDDPEGNSTSSHNKIIDSATLIYRIESTVSFPSGGSATTAKLGTAVLGSMVLGAE